MKDLNLFSKNTMEAAAKRLSIPTVKADGGQTCDGQSQGEATLHSTPYTLHYLYRYAASVLLLLCLGVGNVWGETAVATSAGTYSFGSTNIGAANKFAELSTNSVFIFRYGSWSTGNSGIKGSGNLSGFVFYLTSPMTLSTTVYQSDSKSGGTATFYVKTITSAFFQSLVDGSANSTVLSDPSFTAHGSYSKTSEQTSKGEFSVTYGTTLTAGYYYVYAQTSDNLYHRSITLTSAASCSDETGLAYGTSTVNKTYGDASFTNTLTNSNSLSVTYSSDDTNVATVNESTGAVTIVGAGSTTIRASWAGNSTYCEDEVSYTLNVKPAVGSVTGRWDRFGGETISLSVSPSGGSSYSYQWQKYYNSTWNNVSNGTSAGVVTSGATTANLQIANCAYNNSGSYRCVVTSGGQTNETDGRQVKVYVLECYNGGTTVYNFTRTGSSQAGTLTIDLSASTAYTFKVHADNEYFGNNASINEDITNYVFCNSNNGGSCASNFTINSGLGGTFTIGIDYSTGGNSNVEGEPEISVTYPRKTIYLSPGVWTADDAKFAYYYFRTSGGSGWTDFLTEDDCGMYADIPQWNGVKINAVRLNKTTESTGSWDDKWNQTSDITITSNDYVEITGWGSGDSPYDYDSDYSTPTYTISYNKGSTTHTGGNSISGSKSNESKTCGVDFTLPSSAIFTTTGYTQDGWATSDGGSKDYNLGGSYTTNAAATFYPHWAANSHTLTWAFAGGDYDDENGAAYTAGGTVNYGTSITYPEDEYMSKTGYDFAGWSTDATTMPDENLTITATWTAKEYTITYKDGGNTSFSGLHIYTESDNYPTKHTYGTATTLHKACKDGYVFGGWFTASDCNSGNTNLSLGATAITSAPTLYAKWTAMSLEALANNTLYKAEDMVPDGVTISDKARNNPGVSANNRFNVRGTSSSGSQASGGMKPRPHDKKIEGVNFTSYHRFDKPASGTKGTALGSTLPTNHAIQFVISGAGKLDIYCYCSDSIYIVKDGESAEALSNTASTYHKITKSVTEGTYYLYSVGVSANPRIYGLRFRQNYTITYNTDGASEDQIANGTKTHGDNFTLSSTRYTKDGYWQTGWATSQGGSQVYAFGATYTGNANLMLYPAWTPKAEYEPDLTTSAKLSEVISDSRWTLTTGANVVSDPATVGGDAATNLTGSKYGLAFAKSGSAKARFNLGAETKIYQVTVQMVCEGKDATTTIQFEDGSFDATKDAEPDPEWDNEESTWTLKEFTYTYPEGTSDWQYINIYGNSTYYLGLHSIKVEYAPTQTLVKLDNQSATSAGTTSVTATWHASTNLTSSITKPTKTGYTFGGYYTGTSGSGTQLIDENGAWIASKTNYTDGSKNWQYPNADLTLYAKWTINQYDVTATLNHTTKASGTTGSNAATYNTEYSATFTAADGYVLPSDVTVTIGGVAQTKGTGYTWSVSDGTGTFTVPAAKVTGDIAVTITSTEDECGITLTQFGTQYKSGSNPRYLYSYTSNSFDEKFIIEADDSNTKGVTNSSTDSLYLLVKNGKFAKIHASAVLKDSTFEDVTKIKFDFRIAASKSKTLTLDVYVGATKVGTVSQDVTDQTWYTKTINVSPAKDGRVIIKNTAGSSDQSVHLNNINICGTLPTPCTSITPTWSTDYSSTTLDVGGSTSSTPVVDKDGSSGSLSFSSSDTDIATVNSSTGVVTPKKTGSVTITATVAADDENNYCEGSITKTFTIRAGVTYDGNGKTGGSVPTDASKYAAGATVTTKTNSGSLEKTGYVFNGWNTKADGTGTHYEAGATFSMPTKSAGVKLYAEWVGYATSWEWWNCGQSNNSTTFTYLTGKNYVLSFASSGSTDVASWDISGGAVYRGVKIKTKDHNMSFWVQSGKRVSITFGYMSTKPTFTVGGVNKAGDLSTSTTDSATVTYTTSADTKFYIENETSTGTAFTIKRVKIEDDGYTVTATATMNMTGTFTGSDDITNSPVAGIESETSVSSLNNTFTIGETTVTAPTTIAGTVFVEAESDYVGCTWRFDQWNNLPATVTADVDDVEAEYIPTFGITYNTNGGTINAGRVDWYEYTGSSSNEVTLPTNVTKEGYTFVKWMQDCSEWSGADVERSVITCDNYGNFSLYAVWSEDTHTVTVSGGDHGTASPSSVSGVGIATASGNITATPATGYNFSNWTLPDGVTAAAGKTSSSNPIQINATADSKTITATYTPINYTITYNLNSGTNPVSPAPKTSYTIEDEDYDLPTPTYSGHVFQGWYTDEEFTSDRVYVLASGSTGNKTYYAKWGAEVSIVWDIDAVDDKLYKGGGGHTVTAVVNDASWTGSASSLVLAASDGVVLGTATTSTNGDGKAQIEANFDITEDVEDDEITFYLTAPANGTYGAIEASHDEDLDACPTGGGGSSNVSDVAASGYTAYQEKGGSNVVFTSTPELEKFKYKTLSGALISDPGNSAITLNNAYSCRINSSSSNQGSIKTNSSYSNVDSISFYFATDTKEYGEVAVWYSTDNFSTDSTSLLTKTALASGKDNNTFYRKVLALPVAKKVNNLTFKFRFTVNGTTGKTDYIDSLKVYTSSSGSDGVATALSWETDLSGGVAKTVGDPDFSYTASVDKNTLGAITYSSNAPSVATVNATTGKVHIVGAGSATITATLADCGCYNGNTATYDITVTSDCSDVAGTVSATDLGCKGVELTVSGHTGEGVNTTTINWYKDGTLQNDAKYNNKETITVKEEGEWYAETQASGGCAMSSSSVTIDEIVSSTISPTIFADEFTVKRDRPAEYRLMQLSEGETIKSVTNTLSWALNNDFAIDGPDENNIVSIRLMITDSDPIGNGTITITIENECDNTENVVITIHAKAADAKPQIAWIATGTKGDKTSVLADESTNTALYKALEATGDYDLTPRNCYWSVSEADLIKEYSQYDLVILTDYPNSQTGPNGKGRSKSYTNALGLLIDHVPMLTFEAFVSGCPNWGFESNPENTASTQNSLTLLCNAGDIFDDTSGKFAAGESVTVGGVSSGNQSLQGFELDAMPNYVFIAKITDGGTDYVTCCERQENINARMMVFGLNANVMDAITATGQQMVIGFVDYLLKDENASIPDCSVIFKGTTDSDWSETANWEGGSLPNPYASVRLDKPCVVADGDIAKAGYIKIHVSTVGNTYTGSLTISPQAAMIVENRIYRVEDDAYTDYLPTEPEDLVVESSSSNTGALIFNNDNGRTQATVEMYSKSYWETVDGKKKKYWSYIGIPIQSADIPEYFYNAFTYLYDETSGWIKKGNGTTLHAFEGIGLSRDAAGTETFSGALASTKTRNVTLSYTAGKGAGMNLIGNSWTAPIQIANFDADDFGDATATVYVYNTGRGKTVGESGSETAGQWVPVPIATAKTGGYTGLKVIPAMNAFEVNTSSRTILTLDYDKLVRGVETNLNVPMRAPRRDREPIELEAIMCVRVNGEKTHTDVWLQQDERFSEAFDNGWEAEYSECDNRSAQFYAQSELGKMAFLAKPDIEGTVLGFAPSRDGNDYTFTFHYIGDEYFYLNDLKLQQSVLIDAENTYSFTYAEGDTNRFYISRTPLGMPQTPTGVDGVVGDQPSVVRKLLINDHIYIIRDGKVYGIDGALVK